MEASIRIMLFTLSTILVVASAPAQGIAAPDDYISPLKNFTVSIPQWNGLQIQDGHDKNGGRVSFHDDFGNLQSITYLRLPQKLIAKMLNNPALRDKSYSGFLHNFAMPNLYRPASPESKVIHEEFIGLGDKRAYFAVVQIPEASIMVDVKNNKRMDSVRGVLVFEKRGFVYMLGDEMNSVFNQATGLKLNAKKLKMEQENLNRIKESIIFY